MIDIIFYLFAFFFLSFTAVVIYLNKPEANLKESQMKLKAYKLKVGDEIMTPNGRAVIRKIKSTKIKIPARVDESFILSVNLANDPEATGSWTVGNSNVQVWGHDDVIKYVRPGFFSKLYSFIRSL